MNLCHRGTGLAMGANFPTVMTYREQYFTVDAPNFRTNSGMITIYHTKKYKKAMIPKLFHLSLEHWALWITHFEGSPNNSVLPGGPEASKSHNYLHVFQDLISNGI